MIGKLVVDALLVGGFGVQHSIIAMLRAKRIVRRFLTLDPLAWRGVQSFFNVTYIVIAAILWQDVNVGLWSLGGLAYWAVVGLLVASWIWYFQIHIFEYDCGLAFGSSAVINRIFGVAPPRQELWRVGTRRWLRFPVHTAFLPMFLAWPKMTLSLLVLGISANVYNLIGSKLYDLRLETTIKEPYFQYQARTGLILPPLRRAPKGAVDLTMPAPWHWSRLGANVPGIVLGLLGGVLYWVLLGTGQRSTQEILGAWGAAALLAVAGGVLVGIAKRRLASRNPAADETALNRMNTEISTNTALVSAISIMTWYGISFGAGGQIPFMGVILPMWLTVLWLGHVVAFGAALVLRRTVGAGVGDPQAAVG